MRYQLCEEYAHVQDDKFIYSREGRIIRKSHDFIEHLRAVEAHKQNNNEELKRSHSFLPSTPTTTITTLAIPVQSARTNQSTSARSTKSTESPTRRLSVEDLNLNKMKL